MTQQWYVLRSKPNKEDDLSRQVMSRGIELYYPRVEVKPVNPRSKKIKPFFPGYIFVRVDLVEVGLSMFQWMPYAVGLVSFGAEPATVGDSILQSLRRNIEALVSGKADDFVHLEAGTALKISRGPFAGYEAIFDTKLPGTDRIRILLSLVRGAQIPLDLPVTYVEKKD